MCLKDKVLFVLVELADTCISTMAFNAIIAELFWFVEVTGSNANNAKAWHETFVVEVMGSNANDVKAWRETFSVEDGLLPQEIEPNWSILNSG